MITERIQLRVKKGRTSTTIIREDGELSAKDILSDEVVHRLEQRGAHEVAAIYVEVITK